MAFPSTKQRILDASVRLFNEYGVDAVRLQQIAEDIGISVGNLAYHVKTKDALVDMVHEQVIDEFSYIFRQYLHSPALANFDRQLSLYYQFFRANQFYVAEFFKTGTGSSAHSSAWQQAVNKMLLQLRSWLLFHQQRQALRADITTSHLEQLAQSLGMLLIFHPILCTMRGLTLTENAYKQAIWEHIKPSFTDEGLTEYQADVLPLLAC